MRQNAFDAYKCYRVIYDAFIYAFWITGLDRQQVLRLIRELEPHGVKINGVGRGAYYYFHKEDRRNTK